ncbi:MAG: hypothetical protein M3137_11580 [Actinomycetota bacterium]|nr:hypothetical protein [Actinomycetota bacterium]
MSSEPLDAARDFVAAIAWGEHRRVWELLAREGRRTVLRVAVARGMAESLAARLGDGTATPTQLDAFLGELVNGLRADLAGTDLDTVGYHDDPVGHDGGRAWILLTAPMPPALGGDVPVGTVEMATEDGCWRVERLSPRPGP